MSFYSMYKIVKDIIRTIFGHRFWRKLLIVIIIAIGIWFVLHDKGYCVEETQDINYSAYSYYDNLTNNAISFLGRYYINNPNSELFNYIKNNDNNWVYYFYYGAVGGGDYLGSIPTNKRYLNILIYSTDRNYTRTPTTYDYLGLTGYTMYQYTGATNSNHTCLAPQYAYITQRNIDSFYMPYFLFGYKSSTWLEFEQSIRDNNMDAILQLLEDIKSDTEQINESLTSTDYDDTAVSVSNSTIEDMPNSTDGMFTTLFDNFNTAVSGGVTQIEIPLPHTEQKLIITSDIVSSHLGNLTYLINAFWMYVFGLYTWRFVNNLIHRIKDGSILDGFKSDSEVITNTML